MDQITLFVGVFLILDGLFSILFQIHEKKWLLAGRVLRILVGAFVVAYSFFLPGFFRIL